MSFIRITLKCHSEVDRYCGRQIAIEIITFTVAVWLLLAWKYDYQWLSVQNEMSLIRRTDYKDFNSSTGRHKYIQYNLM